MFSYNEGKILFIVTSALFLHLAMQDFFDFVSYLARLVVVFVLVHINYQHAYCDISVTTFLDCLYADSASPYHFSPYLSPPQMDANWRRYLSLSVKFIEFPGKNV